MPPEGSMSDGFECLCHSSPSPQFNLILLKKSGKITNKIFVPKSRSGQVTHFALTYL